MSSFVDNDGLRIEVLFSGNGVRAVSSQWATQGRVLHNGSLSLFGIVGERRPEGAITWSNGATWQPLAATPSGPFSPADTPARSHTWVQVARYPNLGYAEGQGYGCWFARDPSSRMWVRAGRVKVFADRKEAARFFCGPIVAPTKCAHPEFLAEALAARMPSALLSRRVPICRLPGCECECSMMSMDAWWPIRAHLMGLDAFEIRFSAKWWGNESLRSELVVTTKECLTQEQPLGLCAPVPLAVGTPTRPTHACGTCDDLQCLGDGAAPVEEFDRRCRPHVKDQLGPQSCPTSGRTPLAHRGPWAPPTIARRQEYLDLEFGRQFGNKTLEREGCRDLEQCRTHWAARRASVVETLAREPPLSDRGVYA